MNKLIYANYVNATSHVITQKDITRGYFEAEAFDNRVYNVTFDIAYRVLNATCQLDNCDCISLRESGLNKDIFFLKDIMMMGIKIIKTSNSTVVSQLSDNKQIEVPKSIIYEYINTDGEKIRESSQDYTISTCITLFSLFYK
jgi:hypothetical protein